MCLVTSALCEPMDCSLPGSSVHGILWARILEWAGGSVVKSLPANAGDTARSLGQEDLLENEMATPSSILTWDTPWTEKLGGL